MTTLLRPALTLFILLTVITGFIYPLAVTGIAQAFFPAAASGSLIIRDGKPVGSTLLGQNFTDPKYFWGRPSATATRPYNGTASGGSNQGPLNPALIDAIKARIETLHAADPTQTAAIPVDLVTTSGSGLDPHISPAAASYQLGRVATARALPLAQVAALIDEHTQGRQWGIFGQARVNVLALNLALDDRLRE